VSNIFDFLGILGSAAMILPIPFITAMRFDMIITALATVMLLAITLISRKYVAGRWQKALLVFVYCAYIVSVALRENGL
jgi:Ca2+/Na+ antiporter